jgi:hypothetical protein
MRQGLDLVFAALSAAQMPKKITAMTTFSRNAWDSGSSAVKGTWR